MEKNLNNSHAMGTDSITRLMWRFSLPAIVGMLANALYNIVDRLFVGQTVGAAGIGAISVVFPFMILVISFDLLVASAQARSSPSPSARSGVPERNGRWGTRSCSL